MICSLDLLIWTRYYTHVFAYYLNSTLLFDICRARVFLSVCHLKPSFSPVSGYLTRGNEMKREPRPSPPLPDQVRGLFGHLGRSLGGCRLSRCPCVSLGVQSRDTGRKWQKEVVHMYDDSREFLWVSPLSSNVIRALWRWLSTNKWEKQLAVTCSPPGGSLAQAELVHSCTIFLCCLHDPNRDPNMNNNDHQVGL